MDEVEKYKQRLEAIAEKRRQQEEQDRARREMEDEKLRLQQLKRKSLRDQWLMEGAPLSPSSLNALSPPWGSEAQENEKHNDRLQAESQLLTEKEENEQMEDGQVEAVIVAKARTGSCDQTNHSETTVEVKMNKSPPLEGTAVVLTNGGGEFKVDTNHNQANGCFGASEVVRSNLSEAEPGRVPGVNINEEEGGTLVIRAERVIITDEGDDVPEDITLKEAQSEETALLNREEGEEGGERVEEVIKTEAAPETFTQPEKNPPSEPTPEQEPVTEDTESGIKTNEDENRGIKAEDEDKQSEDPTSVQPRPPAPAVEGISVASVPVYTEMQPCTVTPTAEAEAVTSPERERDSATASGQFQEVPLADPCERTEAGVQEQEPLLSQAKAHSVQAEPAAAAANSPVNTDTHSPTTASQADEAGTPKHQSCKCCTIM